MLGPRGGWLDILEVAADHRLAVPDERRVLRGAPQVRRHWAAAARLEFYMASKEILTFENH